MMDKNEAVQKLATAGRLSIAHAEDLYDSFFEKPIVPQYVADWYRGNKNNLEVNLMIGIHDIANKHNDEKNDFEVWLSNFANNPIQTLVNMHQFGYEVEKETRYTVRIKGVDGYATHLNKNLDNHEWFFASDDDIKGYRIKHTRKELEDANFGWVFDCEGIEIVEVEE